jgi:V-type H+-transporting ATPase subunit a
MFGDVMHGTLLFIIASIICFSKREPGTIFALFGPIRHLLLLMGFFSTFCGFIYNDFTSIPMKIFGNSCYHVGHSDKSVTLDKDCVYPVGVDPTWYLA